MGNDRDNGRAIFDRNCKTAEEIEEIFREVRASGWISATFSSGQTRLTVRFPYDDKDKCVNMIKTILRAFGNDKVAATFYTQSSPVGKSYEIGPRWD